MSRRLGLRSSLLLVASHLDEEPLAPVRAELPAANLNLLVRRGTNPRKQRKGNRGPRRTSEDDRGGKSGEISRKGGK